MNWRMIVGYGSSLIVACRAGHEIHIHRDRLFEPVVEVDIRPSFPIHDYVRSHSIRKKEENFKSYCDTCLNVIRNSCLPIYLPHILPSVWTRLHTPLIGEKEAEIWL